MRKYANRGRLVSPIARPVTTLLHVHGAYDGATSDRVKLDVLVQSNEGGKPGRTFLQVISDQYGHVVGHCIGFDIEQAENVADAIPEQKR